jgi:hypothetical protein
MMLKANAWQQAHPVMKENDRNWERGTWHTGVMAAALAECQGDDGLWRANLADPEHVPGMLCSVLETGVRSDGFAWHTSAHLMNVAMSVKP